VNSIRGYSILSCVLHHSFCCKFIADANLLLTDVIAKGISLCAERSIIRLHTLTLPMIIRPHIYTYHQRQ
jgi:hypothetical protein